MRFNKFGWYALSRDQRAASNWFGACIALFLTALAVGILWNSALALLVAGFAVGMALPLVTIYQCDIGWPRQRMTAFTSAMAAIGGAALTAAALNVPQASMLLTVFVFGFIATPWIANYLTSATAVR